MLERLAPLERRYDEVLAMLANPEVSADYSRVQKLLKEQASLKKLATLAKGYRRVVEEMESASALSRDSSDEELAMLARDEIGQLEQRKGLLEREVRLALVERDPNDEKNVIMEVRAGTGGDEAGLFAADLFRMYSRYAQRRGWQVEVVDSSETGLGAIKEIIFEVKGTGAYSRLKHERGGHRVQRIPVTESGGRIHTSAATVAVLPKAEEVDVDIRPDDLRIDIYHAGGHGGQNVQKVATAIRITHIPTGIVAICQDERSQLKNKEKAMSVLRSRVLAREVERQQQEVSAARRSQIGSGDRSDRVRTFNFPQNRVSDHRTGLTSHNLEAVLDGDIDEFIEASIAQEQELRLEAAGLR